MDTDIWGNLRGEPVKIIDENHEDNFIKIMVYKAGDLYTYGFQLKVGTIVQQKAANINNPMFESENTARVKASLEIENICAKNRNSRKFFLGFTHIQYSGYSLFDDI